MDEHKEVLHTEVEHMKEGRMETVDIDTNDRDKGMGLDSMQSLKNIILTFCLIILPASCIKEKTTAFLPTSSIDYIMKKKQFFFFAILPEKLKRFHGYLECLPFCFAILYFAIPVVIRTPALIISRKSQKPIYEDLSPPHVIILNV
ncbi:hypothetical protein ACJX0J_039372, partial [Zea mays]